MLETLVALTTAVADWEFLAATVRDLVGEVGTDLEDFDETLSLS